MFFSRPCATKGQFYIIGGFIANIALMKLSIFCVLGRFFKTKNRKNDGPKPLVSNTIVEMGLIHSWAAHPGDGGVLDLKLIKSQRFSRCNEFY